MINAKKLVNDLYDEIKALNSYDERKEKARKQAIEWQLSFNDNSYTWADLYEYSEYFTMLGKKYGLTDEFVENAII